MTAAVFVPNGIDAPRPGIVYTSGHTQNAFRHETYQTVILNLVKRGFVVLAYDPIGQGERMQYADVDHPYIDREGTAAHSYVGAQCFLSGGSLARYWVWSGMRAIDVLEQRDDVDPDRIGVTGRSGGGTFTAYIGAFDRRVRAPAPECYLTSFRHMWQDRRIPDGEQVIPRFLSEGLNHPDFLLARMPNPTLMIGTTRDFFPIEGFRDTFREVRRAYRAMGAPDAFRKAVDEAGHTSTEANREALYAFFMNTLNRPGPEKELEVDLFSEEELTVTDTGQVVTSREGRTVFDVNRDETKEKLERLSTSRNNLEPHLKTVRREARDRSGFQQPDGGSEAMRVDRFQRDGYVVEKHALEGGSDAVMPFLLMIPEDEGPHPAVLYLHPEAKAAEAKSGGEMEALVQQGYIVLTPDLMGMGETGPPKVRSVKVSTQNGLSHNVWFGSLQVGRSLVGLWAEQVVQSANYLASRADVHSESITAVARETASTPLIYGAAFSETIDRIALINPLISYRSLVMNRFYRPDLIHSGVPGALEAYDLPDLMATLADRPLLVVNPINHRGNRTKRSTVDRTYEVVRSAYQSRNAESNLSIAVTDTNRELTRLKNWLER